jgi:outer membrane protein OmpA-like peptidoglycan-associated protein
MKINLLLLAFITSSIITVAQIPVPRNPKNCYEEYYKAFIERGTLPVPDGEQNVVYSLRTDTGCYCGQGKVTVKNGKIEPYFLVKKADGTFEEAKRELHVNMKQGDVTSQAQYEIYKGMSHTFQTTTFELADLFFIDYLKRGVVENAKAPNPNEIGGVQMELPKEEKEIIQKAYEGLVFDNGKATIKKESFSHLNLLASMLNEKKDYKLLVKGFTDNVGKAESNLTLSKNRANAVKAYLVKKGMDESRITAEGYGMENPIADNKTSEGRAKNRRVEFIVTQ